MSTIGQGICLHSSITNLGVTDEAIVPEDNQLLTKKQ